MKVRIICVFGTRSIFTILNNRLEIPGILTPAFSAFIRFYVLKIKLVFGACERFILLYNPPESLWEKASPNDKSHTPNEIRKKKNAGRYEPIDWFIWFSFFQWRIKLLHIKLKWIFGNTLTNRAFTDVSVKKWHYIVFISSVQIPRANPFLRFISSAN